MCWEVSPVSIPSICYIASRSSRQVFVDSEVVFDCTFCKRFSEGKVCFFLLFSLFSNLYCFLFRKKGFLYLYITFLIKDWKIGGFINFVDVEDQHPLPDDGEGFWMGIWIWMSKPEHVEKNERLFLGEAGLKSQASHLCIWFVFLYLE